MEIDAIYTLLHHNKKGIFHIISTFLIAQAGRQQRQRSSNMLSVLTLLAELAFLMQALSINKMTQK